MSAPRPGFGTRMPTCPEGRSAAAVPSEMIEAMSLIGPPGHVAERLAAYAAADVTTLYVPSVGGLGTERVAQVAAVVELADG